MSPRVTVVLCSYNQGQYVADAVNSVLSQTYPDWELVVIDNGSTDGSREILRAYEGEPRVRLHLHDDNVAVSRRFNEGVALARGEFVSFLYSDDWYLPNKLARQVERFDALPADYGVVYGPAFAHAQRTGQRWELPGFRGSGWVLNEFLAGRGGAIDMLSPLTRTECFRRYRFYDDIFAEGEASFFKVAMTYRFAFLEEPLVTLRNHEGNRGRAIRRNAEMTIECLRRLEAHPDFPASSAGALKQRRIDLWQGCGWAAARLDLDGEWALQCFRSAIALSGWVALRPRTIAGCFLAVMPARLRRRVNKLGHGLRGQRGDRTLVDDYGGAAGELPPS
jgi:glycosyltransferase involved in cell wall biosynthesis